MYQSTDKPRCRDRFNVLKYRENQTYLELGHSKGTAINEQFEVVISQAICSFNIKFPFSTLTAWLFYVEAVALSFKFQRHIRGGECEVGFLLP